MEAKENGLNREAFLIFLGSIISERDGTQYVRGQKMDATRARSYFRWRKEGATPGFFTADRWLAYFEIHINEYFDFCQDEGRNPWAEHEPSWHLSTAVQ